MESRSSIAFRVASFTLRCPNERQSSQEHMGGTAIGSYVMYSRDVATIEIAAAAGLDFVQFDLEHRLHDSATLHDLCQVA